MNEVIAVEKSYGRCCVNPRFIDRFYEIFLASHPSIRPMFAHTDMTKQKVLLRQGLAMMIMHAAGKPFGTVALDRIGDSHGPKKLNIPASLYQYWIESLMTAIKECDLEFSAELDRSWRKILQTGVDHIIARGMQP